MQASLPLEMLRSWNFLNHGEERIKPILCHSEQGPVNSSLRNITLCHPEQGPVNSEQLTVNSSLRNITLCHPELVSGSSHSKTLGSTQKEKVVAHSMGQMLKRSWICSTLEQPRLCALNGTVNSVFSLSGLHFVSSVRKSAVQHDKKRKVAFTLAEVLITLGIIGVVAALTLPTLINNYQKQETISKLKKVYAMLCNTTTMAVAEYGDTTGWDVGDDLNWENGKAFAEKYMIPYLKVARVCENNNTSDCNYPISKLNGQSFNNNNEYTKSYRFYLVDGTFICVTANRTFANLHDKLVQIIFDINGQKNPNKLGRDVFFLEYFIKPNDINVSVKEHEGKLLPSFFNRSRDTLLGTEDGEYCNKDKSGKACLALIFIDGWEIKDDYPW